MPNSIPDLAWYTSTALIVLLISIVAILLGWGFVMLCRKFDEMKMAIEKWSDHVVILERRMEKRDALCDERHKQIERMFVQG